MGFDDALNKLNDLARRAANLDGEHSVPFADLFPEEFMLRNTEFQSVDAMMEQSGFKVVSEEDMAAIPDEEWDTFIRARTRFDSWEEMKGAAVQEWASRKLGFE